MNNINKNVIAIAILAVVVGVVSTYLIMRTANPTTTLTDITASQHDGQTDAVKTQSTGKYLEIKEYGVRLPILAGMEDMSLKQTYQKQGNYNLDLVYLFSTDLDYAAKASSDLSAISCNSRDYSQFGVISRFQGYPEGDDMPMRDGTYVVGKYYIGYAGPQDICTTDKSVQELISAKTKLVQQAFAKMQSIDGKPLAVVQQGRISGSYAYPSEGIPPEIKMCAELVDKSKSYCMTSRHVDPKYKYGEGFEIMVPVGNYYVYSTLAENPRDPKAKRAYYDKFVTCGMTAECKDKTPIVVKVTQGSYSQNIDPIDWY